MNRQNNSIVHQTVIAGIRDKLGGWHQLGYQDVTVLFCSRCGISPYTLRYLWTHLARLNSLHDSPKKNYYLQLLQSVRQFPIKV